MWPEKKTYPYIVATFVKECKRGNTEIWLPIRRGGGGNRYILCDRTKILLNPPLVPVNSPSQKKVLGSLWQLEELMEESSAQTDQPNHLSWKLYFSWHLWARFLLLNLKWHKNIIYCFHTDYHFKVFYCVSDNALMETFCFVNCKEHYWPSNNCVKIYPKHY